MLCQTDAGRYSFVVHFKTYSLYSSGHIMDLVTRAYVSLRWRHSRKLGVKRKRGIGSGDNVIGSAGLEDIVNHFQLLSHHQFFCCKRIR